jgi:hypothetical protein
MNYAFDERAGEFCRAGGPAQISGSRLVDIQNRIDGCTQARGHVRQVTVVEHHRPRQ